MQSTPSGTRPPALEVLGAFTRLGLTSFGGPVAHIGYFHTEFVKRRKWLDDEKFSGFVALSNTLPGPSSSQVGMLIGYDRAGVLGAVLAWVAFTLPSAAIMTAFALGLAKTDVLRTHYVHGLLVAACAVVATAILDMIRTLAPDWRRLAFALACGAALIVSPQTAFAQVLVIALGALVGRWLAPKAIAGPTGAQPATPATAPVSRSALVWGILFAVLLGLSFAAPLHSVFGEISRFYQAGALVFGGGHVVLPLLQTRFVTPGIVPEDAFLAGYAATQAMPGPLFSFSSYLGAVSSPVAGIAGAALGLVSIYLPTFLLLAAIIPVWDHLRGSNPVRNALIGVNAAVIGLLIAALYRPLLVTSIHGWSDISLAVLAFIALSIMRVQPIFVLAACAFAAGLLAR